MAPGFIDSTSTVTVGQRQIDLSLNDPIVGPGPFPRHRLVHLRMTPRSGVLYLERQAFENGPWHAVANIIPPFIVRDHGLPGARIAPALEEVPFALLAGAWGTVWALRLRWNHNLEVELNPAVVAQGVAMHYHEHRRETPADPQVFVPGGRHKQFTIVKFGPEVWSRQW